MVGVTPRRLLEKEVVHRGLTELRREAETLRSLGVMEKQAAKQYDPRSLWLKGDYTSFNKDNN